MIMFLCLIRFLLLRLVVYLMILVWCGIVNWFFILWSLFEMMFMMCLWLVRILRYFLIFFVSF